jgi:hypothetical protein
MRFSRNSYPEERSSTFLRNVDDDVPRINKYVLLLQKSLLVYFLFYI